METTLTIVEPRMRPVLEAHGLRRYEDYLAGRLGKVVSSTATTDTWRISIADSDRGEVIYYLKIYRYRLGRWRPSFLPDKNRLEARNYRILRERCGVNVPDVIAHGSRRRGWRLLDGFILTRAVPNAVPLARYAAMHWPNASGAAAKELPAEEPPAQEPPTREPPVLAGGYENAPVPPAPAWNPSQDGDTGSRPVFSNSPRACGTGLSQHAARLDETRRYLLAQTAAMVSRMHASGFYHVDLQWRNLLVADNGTTRPPLFVIDSERGAIRHGALYRAHGQLRDLSSLYKEARRWLTRTDQIRWLRRYWGSRRLSPVHHAIIHTILRDRAIKDETWIGAVDLDATCPSSPGPADHLPRLPDDWEQPRSIPFVRCHDIFMDARATGLLKSAGINDLSGAFAYAAGESMGKPGLRSYRQRLRAELAGDDGRRRVFYLKRYSRPPWIEQVRRMREFRVDASSAAREVHFIRRLGEVGIPTVKPVAFGQKMVLCWEIRSFILTEGIEGQSLERMAQTVRSDPSRGPAPAGSAGGPDQPRRRLSSFVECKREIIRQLALVVRQLHANRLFHRDLYLSHVFVTPNADGRLVVRLIDLARMIEEPWRARRWRIKDLASLEYSAPAPLVTRADRVRFLYHYLPDSTRTKPQVRRLIASVQARARRMARHDANRARRWGG